MKKIRNAFAGIAVLISTLSFETLKDWYLIESSEFSIEFPKKPEATNQNVHTEIGDLKTDMFVYETSKDGDVNFLYGLATSEYPDSLINSGKTAMLPTFFRNAVDAFVKNVQGKLLSEKPIEINGFPGKEVKIYFQDSAAIIKMRLYLVRNKAYVMQTITETSEDNNADVMRFHNSFKLKK